jgi:HK97 family phage portal protein
MGFARMLANAVTRGHVLGAGEEGEILLGGQRTAAGETVTEETALKVAAVYSCVTLISSSVRLMPLEIRQDVGDGILREDRASALWTLLCEKPNPEMAAGDLWEWVVKCLLLRGNAYLYLMRDRLGRVQYLWPLNPRRVYVRRDLITREKVFEVFAPDNFERVEFSGTSTEILHIKGFDSGALVGKSVIHHQRETIGRALREDRHAAETLRNNARPGGILKVKGRLKPEQADKLSKSWTAAHGGGKSGGTAVLEEDTSWEQVTMSVADLELIAQRAISREDVAMAFQVPADMVAVGSKSNNLHYSSDSSRDLRLVKYGVLPWTNRIQGSLEICDMLPWRYGVTGGRRVPRFDPDALLQADIKTRYEAYASAIGAKWMAPNEPRRKENLEPVDGLDKPLPAIDKPAEEKRDAVAAA